MLLGCRKDLESELGLPFEHGVDPLLLELHKGWVKQRERRLGTGVVAVGHGRRLAEGLQHEARGMRRVLLLEQRYHG